MDAIDDLLREINGFVWGVPLLALLLGTGVWLTILLKGVQFRYLGYAMKQAITKQNANDAGDISHFESLMTSLAGAIGTGTIVGVSTAIALGGLGAIFWMWITAFLGMATKYAESLLAVKYRVKDSRGEMCGGPMQYIERGLGWKWMAVVFAVFGAIAAIGTGNLVQVNAIAEAAGSIWAINPWYYGVAIAAFSGLVILGGVQSIGRVSSVLVPAMAMAYIAAGLYIIVVNIEAVPAAFTLIVTSAFDGQAALGGFAGAGVMMAIQMGVSRSVFSNEAGLGISTMAAAAAKTDSPGRQAMITMTGALISTVIICSMTGLVIAVTNVLGQVDASGKMLTGAGMAIAAFDTSIKGGALVVAVGLILFAFTTVIAWAYYGEKCFEYLFGERSVMIYRVLFTLIIIPGAALRMETAWYAADIMNGLMVIPNLIAVIGLSKVILEETRTFLAQVESEKQPHVSPTEVIPSATQ